MKYILYIFLIITLSSCEDFFQTTMNVDPPEHTPSLVLHMYINDNDDSIMASVSKSIGALESIEDLESLLINDAIVQIKNDNDEVLYELKQRDPDTESRINYVLGLDSKFGGTDQTYKVHVTHPSLGIITAEQTMPRPVEISELEFNNESVFVDEEIALNSLSFMLHDPSNQENYYQIKVLFHDEIEDQWYYIYSSIDSPIFSISYDYDAWLLSDETFDGKEFHINIYVDSYIEDLEGKMYLDIKGISKDFYSYAKSLALNSATGDIGFTEPVSVYNNINNGLGNFSLSSRKLYPVEF